MRGQAWHVRESQQKQIIDRLMRAVVTAEDKQEDKLFRYDLLIALVMELGETRVENAYSIHQDFIKERLWNVVPLALMIKADIREFQRCEEEGNHLLASVIQRVYRMTKFDFDMALQKVEFDEPRKIFGTDRDTDEVDG